MTLKSDILASCPITRLLDCPIPRFSGYHLSSADHGLRSQRTTAHAGPRLPSDRALLAVRRSAGAAERRGTRGDQSRVERSALRHAEAAVLGDARLRRVRRRRLRPRRDDGACVGGVSRARRGRAAAPPRALLSQRRRSAPRSVRHRRPLRCDRGADRRSSRAVCPRAVAAADLVLDPMITYDGFTKITKITKITRLLGGLR